MSRLRSLIPEGEVVWDPELARRRRLDFKTLGKSYIEWKVEVGEGDLARAQAALQKANIVPIFMRDDEDPKISPEADKVEEFCSSITIRSLFKEAREGGPSSKAVALLVERNVDGDIVSRRHNQGPLTARRLYKALKGPRSRPSNTQTSTEIEQVWDARRRHIFITDLDRWSICAIFGTALRYQKTAIRSVMYGHLQFTPRIYVQIPSGRNWFELAFHLPYMPMRDSDARNTDTRQYEDGADLRGYENVSFLNRRGSHSATHRYDAQISFVISGKDDLTWDSHYFDDTYFDSIRDGKRLVEIYDEDNQALHGTPSTIDPSSRGKCEPEFPILDPRQYFLWVLKYSLEHVTAEWTRNVDRVNYSIRDYLQSEHGRQNDSKKHQSSRKLQGLSDTDWILKVEELSNTILRKLSHEFDVIERFFSSHITLFQTDLCRPLVSEIIGILEQLESLKERLESDVKQCEILIGKQGMRFNQESTEAGRKNQFISKLIYPVVIGAAMFSMEAHVLPFKANTATFVCVVLVVGALIHFGYDPLWHAQVVWAVADRSNQHFQAMRLEIREFLRRKPANLPLHNPSAASSARAFPCVERDLQAAPSPGPVIGV